MKAIVPAVVCSFALLWLGSAAAVPWKNESGKNWRNRVANGAGAMETATAASVRDAMLNATRYLMAIYLLPANAETGTPIFLQANNRRLIAAEKRSVAQSDLLRCSS